jgi:endoglucanase Acf2
VNHLLHTRKKRKITYQWVVIFLNILFFICWLPNRLKGQIIRVGSGSYSTSLPAGEIGPQNSSGVNVNPKISSSFNQPVQTNDFWSSLIFPYFDSPYTNILYAHPLSFKAVNAGLEVGHTTDHIFVANDFLYPYSPQLTVGINGLSASKTETHHYGDWTVTALWKDGTRTMEATLGHGLPYVFFKITGGTAVIISKETPTIWHNQNEVLGLTIAGKHYGIFAPTGSSWSGTSTFQSSLNGKDYLSVALLPDTKAETLELFRSRAYAFVTNSAVEWHYNEATAEITSIYSYDTELKDDHTGNVNETLTALYRHQWLNTSAPLTDYAYHSPRGTMKLCEGNSFSTELRFSGTLPALPDRGDYNRTDLLNFVQEAAAETIPVGDTYWNGKAMARFTHLVHIAEQLGAITERDHFLSEIKKRLEEWFTAGGEQEYVYLENWDVLTGYPSNFGADNQINDHHFHASYAIMSAATIAQYDSAWASQENWGGMVNLLIKDANNWDRTDDRFPFLRSYDVYAGHSWAAGHGDFAEGNNQESSSESMNFNAATILWGEATDQDDIRDLGIFLHTTETRAAEQYWFDIDNVNFPYDYPYVAIGMVWGGKSVHSTWFGADPEFIHGINILPVTSGSLYLGRHPDYVVKNYNEIVAERNGQPVKWKDILWEYLALSDPGLALSYYYADQSYEPEAGESRAHTLHWLYNMKKMGHVDTTIFADIPTYSVFRTQDDDLTYVAYNAGSQNRLVTFSDGHSMTVAPKEMKSFSTANENPKAPVALLFADKTSGKSPLTVSFSGSKSFDRNGSALTYHWDFGNDNIAHSADTVMQFLEVGTYKVVLTVANELSLSSKDSLLITVQGNGTPYSGTPVAVPGIVEAEYYDLGGEGVAYHDNDAANLGVPFRSSEGVDLEGANDGGYDIGWIEDGEWVEYTIDVAKEGLYKIIPQTASVPGGGKLHIEFNGEDLTGKIDVPVTGGWQFWQDIDIPAVQLNAGKQVMHVVFYNGHFNLNKIEIKANLTNISDEQTIPLEFELKQNFPNPFNPTTVINYQLPVSGLIRLVVYNILGQELRELVHSKQEAGKHTVTFNAKGLASGIYYYKLMAKDYIKIKKMVVLR